MLCKFKDFINRKYFELVLLKHTAIWYVKKLNLSDSSVANNNVSIFCSGSSRLVLPVACSQVTNCTLHILFLHDPTGNIISAAQTDFRDCYFYTCRVIVDAFADTIKDEDKRKKS